MSSECSAGVRACHCGRVQGVRVCGCAGVQVCGCAGVRACGCAGVRVCVRVCGGGGGDGGVGMDSSSK